MAAVNKMFFTSLPVSVVISADVISGDVISAQPRFHADRAGLGPTLGPRPPKYPPGQTCHVTHIRLSDWSIQKILRSDGLAAYSPIVLLLGLGLYRPGLDFWYGNQQFFNS